MSGMIGGSGTESAVVVIKSTLEDRPARSDSVAVLGSDTEAWAFPVIAAPATVPSRSQKSKVGQAPVPSNAAAYREFRRLCDQMLGYLAELKEQLQGGEVPDEAAGLAVEIELLVDNLYLCDFGKGDHLKKVSVILKSQIGNLATWKDSHVAFMSEAISIARKRYELDDSLIDDLKKAVKRHGLDLFRGTASAPVDAKRKWKTVEITSDDD